MRARPWLRLDWRVAGGERAQGHGPSPAPLAPSTASGNGQEGQEAGASLIVFGFSDTQEVAQVATSNQRYPQSPWTPVSPERTSRLLQNMTLPPPRHAEHSLCTRRLRLCPSLIKTRGKKCLFCKVWQILIMKPLEHKILKPF